MVKVVIREIIISLLVCLAVLLILSVALYNYNPNNKVIPETVEYTPSKEIQTQLNAAVEDNSKEILMTYEVTAQDLEHFKQTNDYNPGKANPFAPVSSDVPSDGTGSGDNGGNSSNNNQGGGSLFENGSSK